MAAAYEGCLLFGVTFLAAYLWLALLQWRWPLSGTRLTVFQGYIFVVIGVYFTYFWHRSGQTLAMKTWRIRLVTRQDGHLSLGRTVWRYLLSWWGVIPGTVVGDLSGSHMMGAAWFLGCCLINWGWAFVDPERQFLYDRWAQTRLRPA